MYIQVKMDFCIARLPVLGDVVYKGRGEGFMICVSSSNSVQVAPLVTMRFLLFRHLVLHTHVTTAMIAAGCISS